MEQLEKREYTRTELAEVTGRSLKSSHFARDIQDDLTKWGYGFEWLPRRGVRITRIPETAEERLAEMMMRYFGLDIQVETRAFACFLYLMLVMEEFQCMPWPEREVEIWYQFDVSIAESTLRRWASRLLAGDHLHKIECDGVYWQTSKYEGEVFRKPIDAATDEGYARYKARQRELIDEYLDLGLPKSKAWSEAFKQLWREFECCYYRCPRFVLNGISSEMIGELCDIVVEICEIED